MCAHTHIKSISQMFQLFTVHTSTIYAMLVVGFDDWLLMMPLSVIYPPLNGSMFLCQLCHRVRYPSIYLIQQKSFVSLFHTHTHTRTAIPTEHFVIYVNDGRCHDCSFAQNIFHGSLCLDDDEMTRRIQSTTSTPYTISIFSLTLIKVVTFSCSFFLVFSSRINNLLYAYSSRLLFMHQLTHRFGLENGTRMRAQRNMTKRNICRMMIKGESEHHANVHAYYAQSVSTTSSESHIITILI